MTLPADTQVLVTRTFNAPARLIYRAWTTPELIKRWWHANRGDVIQADADLRVGGKWRWVLRTRRQVEVAFSGEYREVVPGKRLVFTEAFEGYPGDPAVTTVTFVEEGDRTIVSVLTQHTCREDRDAHINSGMEAGMQDAMDLLEETAIALRSP